MLQVGVLLRIFLGVVYVPAGAAGFELIKSSVTSKWAQAAYVLLYVPFAASIVYPGPSVFRELTPVWRLAAQATHSVAVSLPLIIGGFLLGALGGWSFSNGFMMGKSGESKDLQLAVLGVAMTIAGVVHSTLVWVPATW